MYRELGDPLNAALTLNYLGFVACDRGDRAGAAARFAAGLPLWRQLGDLWTLADWLAGVATLAVRPAGRRSGRPGSSGRRRRCAIGSATPSRCRNARRSSAPPPARAPRWGSTGFAGAWAAGQALPLDQALDEAAELLTLVAAPAPPPEPRGAAYNADLTPRERDVLRLLVAGRSDKEIAAALFIGLRTVQSHAEHLYAKLGVRNRARGDRRRRPPRACV